MSEPVEDPVRRQRYVFSREGEVLRIEVWAQPGADVPKHFHPAQEERFEVVEGEVRFRVGREERLTGPGERIVAPAGVVHAFENTGSRPARLLVEVEPGLELQGFLEEAAALARAGKYTRRGVPKSPRAVLQLAEMTDRYRDLTVVSSPPRFIQRLLFPPLARLERYFKRRRTSAGGATTA